MTISTLYITAFRNLVKATLLPCPLGFNIIHGQNGSGKTNLLEAIYFLAQGRSFRTSLPVSLIHRLHNKFSIFSQLVSHADRSLPVGVERDIAGNMRLRVAESVASMTDMALQLPIRLIHTKSHQLFEAGPDFRRKFLDWGLFYQSEVFLSCWRQFERALRQRNRLLHDRRPSSEVEAWTLELIKQGLKLDSLRRDYVLELAPLIIEIANELVALPPLSLAYYPGWDEACHPDYSSALAHAFPEESRLGYTVHGPHRADLLVQVGAVPVKHFLSRGQQKLLICAMMIAQGRLFAKRVNKRLIYLVDDLPAELDLQSRQKLLDLLSRQPTQIFMTTIESEMISHLLGDKQELPVKMFHVEHGDVSEQS